jgi:hypothetical protein
VSVGQNEHILKVGTWNIWNQMFHFSVRKLRLTEVIRREGVHVVGFQEVRKLASGSQLDELAALLPDYKWKAFVPAMHGLKGDNGEGVAIISKYPILETTYVGSFGSK